MASDPYRGVSRPGEFRARRLPTLRLGRRGGRTRKVTVQLSYSLAAAALSLCGPSTDRNVFLTQPPLFASWGLVLRLLRRQRYCVIAMDLYPWVAVAAGLLRPDAPPARLAAGIARRTLRGAERVVVIGRCMAERVQALGVEASRIALMPNWSDTEAIRPVDRCENGLRHDLGLEDELVVMYSGNLGVSHRFDDLLTVARRLQHRRDIVFLFAGDGYRRREVEAVAAREDLANVRFLPFQPYESLGCSLGVGDVHFVSLRAGFEGLVVPSKAYGALAAGRPILYQGRPEGEIARMVHEGEVGWCVLPGDVDGLEAAVLEAVEDPDRRLELGQRARALAESRYGPAQAMAAYRAVLTQ